MYRVGVLLPIGGGHTPFLLQILSPEEQKVFENHSHTTEAQKRDAVQESVLFFAVHMHGK